MMNVLQLKQFSGTHLVDQPVMARLSQAEQLCILPTTRIPPSLHNTKLFILLSSYHSVLFIVFLQSCRMPPRGNALPSFDCR